MKLSEQNLIIATTFFLGQQQLFDKKDEDYQNMFKAYATDNNSSTLRERVILYYLGYDQIDILMVTSSKRQINQNVTKNKKNNDNTIVYGKSGSLHSNAGNSHFLRIPALPI